MAGVIADSVIVRLEADTARYSAAMEAAAKKTEAVFARIRNAEKGGGSGSNRTQSVERDTDRVVRAKRREAESEEAASARISAAVQKGIDARNRQASEAERAAQRIANAERTAGSRSATSAQTRLMSGTSLSAVSSAPTAAIDAQAKAVEKLAFGTGRAGAATRNLGRNIADIGVGVAGNQPPFLILAQQAPQLADALADTGGRAAKVAQFFAGPWGAALLAAGSVLAVLASKAFEAGESVDDLVDKLRKDAAETSRTDEAKKIFSRTLEGVTNAIRDQEAAFKQLADAEKTAAERALDTAKANVAVALSVRNATAAQAAYAAQLAENARSQNIFAGGPGGAQSIIGAQYATEAERAAARAKAANDELIKEQRLAARAQYEVDAERAVRAADTTSVITKTYDDRIAAIKREDRALIDAGKRARSDSSARITSLEKEKKARIDAAQAERAEAKKDAKAGPLTQFVRPTDGRITSGFGARARPTAGASTNHQGIDYAGAIGAPVRAAAGGVVISSGKLGGFGNAVIIDHGGGTITQYSHLSALAAKKGDTVTAGQNIGAIGATGVATGPHLDFRVKQNGRYVDPTKGRYRTDETAVIQRAETIAKQQDALADRELRNQESFVNEYERLSQQILDLQAQRALTAQEASDIDRANIESEFQRRKSAIATDANAADTPVARERAVTLNGLNEYRRILLLRDAALKEDTAALNDIKDQRIAILDTQRNEQEVALVLADTNENRRKIELQIIDNKYKQLQLELENTRAIAASAGDIKKVAEANREIAKLPGQRAVDERGANLSNENQYDRYRREITGTQSLQDDIDGIKIQTLEAVTDELANATKAALGLKGAFGDIVGELIRIGIQRRLIGPLADALFGKGDSSGVASPSGGGGFLGSLLGSVIKGFAGARASGGNVSAGQVYRVNELGVEGFQPAQSGKIIPLGRMKPAGGNSTTIIQQSFTLDARYGITTPQLIEYVNRTATQKAAQAGRAAYQASPARSAQLDQLGT